MQVSGGGLGSPGAGKTTPACDGVKKALPDTRSFLELMAGHLRSPWRSDEREIPRYAIRQLVPQVLTLDSADRCTNFSGMKRASQGVSCGPRNAPARGPRPLRRREALPAGPSDPTA